MGREQFSGPVKTEWIIAHPQDMLLMENLIFIDANGFPWMAWQRSRINGASIPKLLWSTIGSPFVGFYRRASVLHDCYYMDPRGKTRREVDRMFWEAMIADGVDKELADILYQGVKLGGGPYWKGDS